MSDKPELIRWEEDKEGAWIGYLGDIKWCEWIPPDYSEEQQCGYVFGLSIDGHMVDAETIRIGKNRAESWIKAWLLRADLAKPSERTVKRIYCAGNKTSNLFFESEKDARIYQSSAGAACGIEVWPVDIMPSQIPMEGDTP